MNDFFELFAKFNSEFMGLLFFLMLSFFSAVLFYFIYFKKSFSQKIHSVPESMINNLGADTSSPKSYGEITKPINSSHAEEILKLQKELSDYKELLEASSKSENVIGDELEKENEKLKTQLKQQEFKIKELKSSSAGDNNSKRLLEENEELELRLREYEIIEKDLANLKQIQDENTRLKELIRGKDLEATFLQEFPQVSESNEETVSHEETQSKISGVDDEVVESNEKGLVENLVKDDEIDGEADDLVESSETDVVESVTDSIEDENTKISPDQKDEQAESESGESEAAQLKNEKDEDDLGEVVEIEKDGKEKSADELLSEFEKMLG